jgi:hypothetical protein
MITPSFNQNGLALQAGPSDNMLMFRGSGPLVIGGMGGSGTRVYLRLARLAGWRMIVCPWWDMDRRKIEEGSGDCQPLMKHFYPNWLHRWQRGDMTESELQRMRWSCRFWLFAADPPAHIPFLRRLERWPEHMDLPGSPDGKDDAQVHAAGSTRARGASFRGRGRDIRGRGWGWKNPRTLYLLLFLNDLFPGMRYIHVIRDGRDHAFHPEFTYANYSAGLLTEREEAAADHVRKAAIWRRLNENAAGFGTEHMPGRYLQSRLEDLCDDPAGESGRIFRFLGVEPDPAAGRLVHRPRSLGRWREEPAERVAEAEAAMQPTLARLGYRLGSEQGSALGSQVGSQHAGHRG